MIATRLPLRQSLYVLNLAVGMLLFVCAFSFMGAVTRSITLGLDRFGSDAIIVSKPDAGFTNRPDPASLDRADVARLRSALGDRFEISPVARSVAPVSAGRDEELVTVWRADPSLFEAAGLEIVEGRAFSQFEAATRADVCLVSADILESLGGRNGSKLRQISVEGRSCRVIGTVSSAETIPNFTVAEAVYLPFGTGPRANPAESAPVTQIFLRDRSGTPDAAAGQRIRSALAASDAGRLDIWFASDFWTLRTGIANSLWLLVLLMSCVVLGLAALGLANSLSLDVLQRRGEIGLRIALGATRRDIFAMFLAQGLGVVLAGGLLGSAAGALLSLYVLGPLVSGSDLLAGGEMSIDATTLAAALLVLACTSFAACFVPARQAMKVDPSLAIRNL
ncbi:MAG TPA: ABC transporter permease [Allosphingosinicella sp.]|nr:ABC transporter permease [Allosphingosinicella sp.]